MKYSGAVEEEEKKFSYLFLVHDNSSVILYKHHKQSSISTSNPHQEAISSSFNLQYQYSIYNSPPSLGKLAIVMTGFIRTFNQTCESIVKNLVEQWPTERQDGSGMKDVDVFIFTYNMEKNPKVKGSFNQDQLSCLGKYLTKVAVKDINEVEEKLPNRERYGKICKKIHRLYSQVKTIHLGF